MANLNRVLKAKMEGTSNSNSNSNSKRSLGGPTPTQTLTSNNQGKPDYIAEMTKRSKYHQQIEQDVQKYSKPITDLKSSISTFQTTDMDELVRFRTQLESVLDKLIDESQVNYM